MAVTLAFSGLKLDQNILPARICILSLRFMLKWYEEHNRRISGRILVEGISKDREGFPMTGRGFQRREGILKDREGFPRQIMTQQTISHHLYF